MSDSSMKIAYAKNLNKVNFNSVISVAIDSNVNIKTILNAHAYLFEEKVECGSGKAILTGRIGLKVLYIDTDGISNTIQDSQAISENIIDAGITADCLINILNQSIVANVVSTDGVLKVSCDVSLSPIMYFNLPISNQLENNENSICKKSEVNTICIHDKINTNFEYTTNFETKDTISKILCLDSYFTPTNSTARDGAIYVEGKIHTRILYETQENDEFVKKELCDTFNIVTEVPINNISADCDLDLSFKIDKSKENISTELEDDNSIITILNNIKLCGVCYKKVNLELIDDIFNTKNELEISMVEREFMRLNTIDKFEDKIYGEISITDKEPAIDEIISNLNIMPETTNTYIKNGTLHIEGVISSHLSYIDENKNCTHKHIELPFVLNTKIELDSVENVHLDVNVLDCHAKVKRGTILEFEYVLEVNVFSYLKERKELISNISLGKNIEFNNYDFQIFIAKPGEATWDLCKRIKISPEELSNLNKNLPLVMNGGEKIIIKR